MLHKRNLAYSGVFLFAYIIRDSLREWS